MDDYTMPVMTDLKPNYWSSTDRNCPGMAKCFWSNRATELELVLRGGYGILTSASGLAYVPLAPMLRGPTPTNSSYIRSHVIRNSQALKLYQV